jgi:hypothetical protein
MATPVVKIEDLRRIVNRLLDRVEASGTATVPLYDTFYWDVPEEERYGCDDRPSDLDVRSLHTASASCWKTTRSRSSTSCANWRPCCAISPTSCVNPKMTEINTKPRKERMGVRPLFVMGGVIWGLVLGPDFGLAVAKFMGGLNWTFIAGTRDWPVWADGLIIASGVATGLATFFTALIAGRNLGDRLEYSHDFRLNSGAAIPWAVIAVGITVGGITVLTIEDRQQAVVAYVQDQKGALVRLDSFANQVQRFRSVRVDWPGGGEEGRVSLSFRGKHPATRSRSWRAKSAPRWAANRTPACRCRRWRWSMPGGNGTAMSPTPRWQRISPSRSA